MNRFDRKKRQHTATAINAIFEGLAGFAGRNGENAITINNLRFNIIYRLSDIAIKKVF